MTAHEVGNQVENVMGWTIDVEFKPSGTHGIGAFARQNISAGSKVWVFDKGMKVGERRELLALSREELRFALHGGYLHHPSGKFVWYDDGMQYVNHAGGSGANIGIREWTPLEQDNCTALRDIAAGEELLEDYQFWSVLSLADDHWLRKIYMDHCPEHYDFLIEIETRRAAA
ncbi:MAG: hypothetical protein CVT86_07165 [Alphaproteobacteria bacterium HGW-Alphaproteobacteria-8]|nr:MAG: hypothetical protein CVT86_07165 [Alphaproteobacteria bacterium HGW-Alphaproteobacteria-8]